MAKAVKFIKIVCCPIFFPCVYTIKISTVVTNAYLTRHNGDY